MREINETNLPQLIVGLDSQSEDANYIHINDVKENVDYYCPCCKGLIKPRAYKKDEQYKMQPHFYHINGGCTEETYIHYICKNFLFEAGSKFIVSGIEYEVKEVITEKGYDTKFGIYIPDITVTTTSDKIFYFEIRNTNKKTTDYIPKWDELGNDVVEVDVKQFVNQKFDGCIPEFKLIYSNGECFVREYVHREYEEIERRKLEWKRQDKLNYKIKWERLDWFWRELQEYKCMKCSNEDIINAFKNLPFEDMSFCWKMIHNHKLLDIDQECLKICNKEFDRNLSKNNISYFKIKGYMYLFSVNKSKYFNKASEYITFRRKIKDIELYNNIINKLHIKERNLVQEYLTQLDNILLNDIKEIDIYSNNYHISFITDKHYECGITVLFDEVLSDAIIKYYYKRKMDRFETYKRNKLCRNNYEDNIKRKHIEHKRKKYHEEIIDIINPINECKNKQWHIEYNFCNNADLSIELYFEINDKCYNHIWLNDIYNYSYHFLIKESDIREFKNIILKKMKYMYNHSGVNIKYHNGFKYNKYGMPSYRKLIINIDSEVSNG